MLHYGGYTISTCKYIYILCVYVGVCVIKCFLFKNFTERSLVENLNREGSRAPFTPIKVLEMVPGRRYKVLCMRSVHTKYGLKPVVDLDTGESIFMPAKYAKAIAPNDLLRMNVNTRYTYVTFHGTERDQWNTPILKFTTGEEPIHEPTHTFSAPNVIVTAAGGGGGQIDCESVASQHSGLSYVTSKSSNRV